MHKIIQNFSQSIALKNQIIDDPEYALELGNIASAMTSSIIAGGKIVFCGNGGSCADAQHLTAELLIRLKSSNPRPALPALCLAQDTSTITACGNDLGYQYLFQRLTQALLKPEDSLIGISTSGNSENINLALQEAKIIGAKTIGFLGNQGGQAKHFCDLSFIVPSNQTARIQEVHITAGHAIIEAVEEQLQHQGYFN